MLNVVNGLITTFLCERIINMWNKLEERQHLHRHLVISKEDYSIYKRKPSQD